MDAINLPVFLISCLFVLGYFAIILERFVKVNKTAIALVIAVGCWMIYFLATLVPLSESLKKLEHHVSDVAQIIFFLMGSMALVELIDSHRGFKKITGLVHTSSKRKMLWIIGAATFFLSSILDNLTTTILMVTLLRKIIPEAKDRFLLCCVVVIAANAGGAWTPIGDVTTTMLWINGQISSLQVMKSLFLPSLISLVVPLLIYSFTQKGRYGQIKVETGRQEPGANLVLCVGMGALIFVPVFKAWTGLPPFMGVLIGLAVLWALTDLLHFKHEQRQHLRIPYILTRIDTSGILFFLGILLCIDALEIAGILKNIAVWLDATVKSQTMIAALIGLISALIDNVPLVAATMGMYPLQNYPMDSSFWQLIAYAAGTGGSILIIGSSAGVALMGMEKIDFISYFKKAALPALIGYFAGLGLYLLF